MRAGDRAVSRSAYKEAIAHFSAGLKLAEALPQLADRERRQLDFLVKLGPALMVARGMESVEAEDACRRAAELGDVLGDRAAALKPSGACGSTPTLDARPRWHVIGQMSS
jgi:hypothetical protein